MKRSVARFAAQVAMFVFIIILAWNLHPFLIRYDNDLVWILSFMVILGLLLLPGWLFDRRQKPMKPKIVKIHKSISLPEGGQLFVSRNGIGPIEGFKGFRTTAIYDSACKEKGSDE